MARNKIAYLYRKAGALGLATHWAPEPYPNAAEYEALGIGEWYRGQDGWVLDDQCCPTCGNPTLIERK